MFHGKRLAFSPDGKKKNNMQTKRMQTHVRNGRGEGRGGHSDRHGGPSDRHGHSERGPSDRHGHTQRGHSDRPSDRHGEKQKFHGWNSNGRNRGYLHEDQLKFFRNIRSQMGDSGQIPKTQLLETVIEECLVTRGQDFNSFMIMMNDVLSSKVFEDLIGSSTQGQMEQLWSVCRTCFFSLFTGKFSSFVIQKMLWRVTELGLGDSLENSFYKMLSELTGKFMQLSLNNCSVPVVQTLLEVLSTLKLKTEKNAILTECFQAFKENFSEWMHSGTAVSMICFLLGDESSVKSNIMNHVLGLNPDEILKLTIDDAASHVIQRIIEVSNKKERQKLKGIFIKSKQKFTELCIDQNGCFVVNSLLKVGNDIQDNVLSNISTIFENNRKGLIVTLCERAKDHLETQESVISKLLELVPSRDFRDLVYKLLQVNESKLGDNTIFAKCDRHGSKILMALFSFELEYVKPIFKILQGMEEKQFLDLCLDKNGSLLIETWLDRISDLSEQRTQRKLYRKSVSKQFLGKLLHLINDKYGSHIVDKLLTISPPKIKLKIGNELHANMGQFQNHRIGKIIYNKHRLRYFERNPVSWSQNSSHIKGEQRKNKIQDMFSEIIEGKNQEMVSGKKRKRHFTPSKRKHPKR